MLKNNYTSFLFFITILFFVGFANATDKKIKNSPSTNSDNSPRGTEDVVLYSESWEGGSIGGWSSLDETSTPPQWALNSWMAYGSTGFSWHMADTSLGNNGGYNNSWYQVLDTDPVELAGTTPSLTFYHRYNVEAPGGEPSGYDAWDGMNLRISTNGGTDWVVLTNPTPAYTSTSLYSFGFEHGEGTGIPGWGGSLSDWTLVTFDLSSYAGQTVQVRFAFASDPEYSTPNNGNLFGWQVDDILITSSSGTLFSNDGVETGLTASNWAATGADLWHVQQGTGSSGQYFMSCNDPSDTYAPNMINSLSSDWFVLDPLATDIYMDFSLQGTWSDNGTFPEVDFFGAYIQVQGESERRFVSNITQDPNGDNFVFSDAPPTWATFSSSFSTGLIDLTSLKGETIKIIIEFESDEDTPVGAGLQIDDVIVWTPALLPVELTSFAASVNQLGQVALNWATATEINNRGFEIERKAVDGEYITIGFVEGFGTTTNQQQYSFIDKSVMPGNFSYRLKQVDFNGQYEYSNAIELIVTKLLSFSLEQNYPNPFNPNTNIKYSLAKPGYVKLAVYNTLGEEVKVLVNGFQEANFYDVSFDAVNLPSGTYVYRIETPEYVSVKKMILIK